MALKMRVQRATSDSEKVGAQENPGEATAQQTQGMQKGWGAQGGHNNKRMNFTWWKHRFCEFYAGHGRDSEKHQRAKSLVISLT